MATERRRRGAFTMTSYIDCLCALPCKHALEHYWLEPHRHCDMSARDSLVVAVDVDVGGVHVALDVDAVGNAASHLS